jgi:hypothetical protein
MKSRITKANVNIKINRRKNINDKRKRRKARRYGR